MRTIFLLIGMINKGSKLLMIVRLLEAVKSNPVNAKTRQFQTAGLNITVAMGLADFLVEKGFLKIVRLDGKHFNHQVTSEGLLLLKQINWCFDAVADKPKIGVMQFA